jgi:8-amino-7-oxononanoate synthase
VELEAFLAEFHRSEAAILFGSGFEANLGLLSSLGRRGDTILYDEYSHASMRDGIRLSLTTSHSFRHNDLDDLRSKLSRSKGDVYVAVESLYSMDGDAAPLSELVSLCDERGAFLIVDEAHATGVYGPEGRGLVAHHGLEERVFARVHTFGKALGYRGACVTGSAELVRYLVNFARPFVYSTAPDRLSLLALREAYGLMIEAAAQRARLFELVAHFRDLVGQHPELRYLDSASPIQGILLPGNDSVLEAERELRAAGYLVRGIRSPTVPAGLERLRMCLHAHNTHEELSSVFDLLSEIVRRAR